MSWRPKDWDKIRDRYSRRDYRDLALGKNINMFESGADAMLEALKKGGKYIPGKVKLLLAIGQEIIDLGEKGWVLFTEDKEETV